MQGKQCPNCLRHDHEEFYDLKNRKRWIVDRCKSCKHPFDFEEFEGSTKFFDEQLKRQNP